MLVFSSLGGPLAAYLWFVLVVQPFQVRYSILKTLYMYVLAAKGLTQPYHAGSQYDMKGSFMAGITTSIHILIRGVTLIQWGTLSTSIQDVGSLILNQMACHLLLFKMSNHECLKSCHDVRTFYPVRWTKSIHCFNWELATLWSCKIARILPDIAIL